MMKLNLVTKFSTVALGAVVLLSLATPTALAAVQFNTASGDRQTLQVLNSATSSYNNYAWGNSATARTGDILNFLISYHNTGDSIATNTMLKINLPTLISNGSVVTGYIASNGLAQINGNVSVFLNGGGNQSLTYVVGSAEWYTGLPSVRTSLPFGQNGDEVVNYFNGLNIGNVPVGGSGYILLRAQVGANSNNNNSFGNFPLVNTSSATLISSNAATFYSSINPNNTYTTAWLEYGPTTSLGNTSQPQVINSSSSYITNAVSVYNLNANTTYYYRAAAQNSHGTTYGSILSIYTGNSNNTVVANNQDLNGLSNSLSQLDLALSSLVKTVANSPVANTQVIVKKVVPASSVASGLSKLILTSDKATLKPGDTVVITAEIDALVDISKNSLQINLDPSLVFDSSAASVFTKNGNIITYSLGDMVANDIQIIKLNAHLSEDTDTSKVTKVTTTGTLNYSDSTEVVTIPLLASLDVNVGGSSLFASIFGAFGWSSSLTILLIALLILLVVVAVRKLMT